MALLVAALALAATVAAAASAAGDANGARVVMMSAPCGNDDFVCRPFAAAMRATGVSGRIISPDMREDPVGTLSLLAQQGYDLVIVDVTEVDALAAVAPRFPKTHFALIDAPLSVLGRHLDNVQAVVFEPNEAAYLAGWLAARLEQRRRGKDVVGVVGGIGTTQVRDFIVGFRAGARAADPGITVLTGFSRDFVDPNKCEAVASSQIGRGAGAVFNVAGACGFGTLQAAQKAGVWGIGVDTDQSFLGPHILTSVTKGYGAGFRALFEQVALGKTRDGRTTVLSLPDGGAGLGRISRKVPATLRAELGRVRARIVAGKIHVPLATRRST